MHLNMDLRSKKYPGRMLIMWALAPRRSGKRLTMVTLKPPHIFSETPTALTGRVVMGDKLGRILGYPTANLEIDTAYKLVPADGIYAVTVSYSHQHYKGMLYIGNRPTVQGMKRNIEVNIFDFDEDIYGESLTIFFHKLIRRDARFNDLEELKKQLHMDKEAALKVLPPQ